MKKIATLLLVAVVAGAGGGALVWWAMRSLSPPPVAADIRPEPAPGPERPAPAPPLQAAEARVHPQAVSQSLHVSTTQNVAVTGPVNVHVEADDKQSAVEPGTAPASAERMAFVQPSGAVRQVATTQVVVQTPPLPAYPGAPRPAPAALTRNDIDEALSYALEAADPYVKQGFTIREDYWGGSLPAKGTKAIVHQLYKGNEYWFWLGATEKEAKISVHVYDSEGTLVEVEAKPLKVTGRGSAFAARAVPKKTGSYYLIVEVGSSGHAAAPQAPVRVPWALCYGFR